jgi:predicted phosphoribosyltransferase
VPVAYEVARALGAPLDAFVVRKLGLPGNEELAMGAVASGGTFLLDERVVAAFGIPEDAIREVIRRERGELERRASAYREHRPPLEVHGREVILVDDGLATGSTMTAAVAALRRLHPARIVVAVPVAAAEICDVLRRSADEVVCARTPVPFEAVGLWYDDFRQTTDREVRDLLARAERERPSLEPAVGRGA